MMAPTSDGAVVVLDTQAVPFQYWPSGQVVVVVAGGVYVVVFATQLVPFQYWSDGHVVVVGGGIAGLAAAWRIHDGACRLGHDLELAVLEAEPRPGGHASTLPANTCTWRWSTL